MENITRISDLPENNNVMANGNSNGYSPMIHNQLPPPPSQQMQQMSGSPSGYVPINVHPNPYGVSAQNPIMPHPQQPNTSNKQNAYFSEEQLMQMQRQRLPSRDIPQETASHMQDEQVQPNYIPKVRFQEDYVRKQEDMTENNLREYENRNRRERKLDNLLNELQTPILIAILFFFFQLPIVNMFFKRFSFLSIYNEDGNFNLNGLILKSMMFGSMYYSTMKMTTLLSEF
jgi:hypothetical protein